MAIIDPMVDFIDLLGSKAILTAVVGAKIYGPPGLDREQSKTMPYKCLVVLENGGVGQFLDRHEGQQDIQCRCYGANAIEAKSVERALIQAIWQVGRYTAPSGYLILRADPVGAPTYAEEPETGWPLYLLDVQVHYTSKITT